MSAQTCTTRHRGCDCREAEIRELLEAVVRSHADPADRHYNECDRFVCVWCQRAKRLLADPPTRNEKWYATDEKLPDDNQAVRVIANGEHHRCTFVMMPDGESYWVISSVPYLQIPRDNIRFWQPDEEAKP